MPLSLTPTPDIADASWLRFLSTSACDTPNNRTTLNLRPKETTCA